MKLLTLNCHSWQEDKQIEKIKYLARVIKEKEYDVIALQEVSQLIDSKVIFANIKSDNYILVLMNELKKIGGDGYNFFWDYGKYGFDIYEEGLGIITKHPILDKESFYISKTKDIKNWKSRKITKISVDYKGKPISIYSCHLGWWIDEEEPLKEQVDVLYDKIDKENLSFIMGDFNSNAFTRNEGYDYIISKGLFDTYDMAKDKDCGVTIKGAIDGWEENKKDLRIDLILSNKELQVESSKVIFNGDNKEIVSDHFGVEVEIDMDLCQYSRHKNSNFLCSFS